ncbi:hypothetical protein [Pseudomonas sp. lyk4-TYG-107]|uniref:hypothetical protein n=1 Tax=Pseudomonas sp. lyk4-TYG-107 TaxID=3040317 RepID=UPI0025542954|nr:hypothetical protein [Pseudomonas sp. lyk4-TYG-107]
MTTSTNLFTPAPLSSEQLERRDIAQTMRAMLEKWEKAKASDNYAYPTNRVNNKQLCISTLEGSLFNQAHFSAHIVLRQLVRQPQFVAIVDTLEINDDNWTLVNKKGEIFQVHEIETTVGTFIERIDITQQINEIDSLKADLQLLASSAVMTGGIVSSSDRLPLLNWLQFQQLNLPETADHLQNLIAWLELTLPLPPTHGNYWGISNETGATELCIDEDQQSAIYQVIHKLMDKGEPRAEPLINYLAGALLKKETPTALREYPRRAWALLIETEEAKAFAQSCFEALNEPSMANATVLSTEQRSRLLVAAVMLDLSLGREDKNQNFIEQNIYNPGYVQATSHEVNLALEQALGRRRIKEYAVPMTLELILAGLAPEFLVRTPTTLQIGTPGWVILRKSVSLAETIAPGLSSQMSYDKLLELGAILPTSAQQQTLHDWANLQGIMDWSMLNGLEPENANDLPTQELFKQAASQYNAHLEAINAALTTIATPPVSRRKLAKAELYDVGCDPMMQIALPVEYGYERHYHSVLDVYMTRNLLFKKGYDRQSGTSIYKAYPDLLTLEPINDIYKAKVKEYFKQYKTAINTTVRLTLSRLSLDERMALEFGKVAIFSVRDFSIQTPINSSFVPFDPRKTARFGNMLFCKYGLQFYCFEIFPLQGICRNNPALAEAYIRGQTLDEIGWFTEGPNGDKDFKSLTYLHARIEKTAYFEGQPPLSEELRDRPGIILERFAEFDEPDDALPFTRSPMHSFNSERFDKIGEIIAEHNPPTHYDQFYAISYDRPALEKKHDDWDNVTETILDIVIPFRQCIRGLSSSDPDLRSGAIFSCVMDLTAILFVFAGALGPFSKALGSSTRLLSLSKVGASVALSVFNPLDGVPKLVYGGARLVGKGVMKLSHFGHTVIRAGAGQLRALSSTSSGSYDLVKALSKTGVAAEIRMTLPTLAHARALFKDDALETVEQLVTRLSQDVVSIPKGGNATELQHLFNAATREATQSSKGFQQLESLIGHAAANDVLISFTKSRGPRFNGTKFTTKAGDYSEILGSMAELESRKVIYLKNHQQSVLKLDLGKPPYSDVMPETAFNPQGFTDNAQRAGAWMVKGSSSDNELEHIVAILREYTSNNKSLTDANVVKEIHARLVPQLAESVREVGQPTKYGGSISGYASLEQHLKTLDAAHEHVDKHLLAAIAGFQGFGDGNGRTASAVYAISQLRNNRFVPMPKHVFMSLSDLG